MMAHRDAQPPGYMDGVCVKISEKYKPPPRINLAVTYSQRLSLNNQIRQNINPYDFSLETNITERVRELRNARKLIHEQRRDRLERIKIAKQKYEEEKLKQNEALTFSDKETEIFNVSSENNEQETAQAHILPTMNGGVLYPMYSHILTPTPLTNATTTETTCKYNDKSPFNISDFEADTSSPFDNMELKTINDIEELAQVLKKDDPVSVPYTAPYPATQLYSNYVPLSSISTCSNVQPAYLGQETLTSNMHYSPYITSHHSSAFGASPAMSLYNSNVNGYYYPPEVLCSSQNFQPYAYNNIKSDENSPSMQEGRKAFRSVPDIMKALEAKLDNTQISRLNHIPENHEAASRKSDVSEHMSKIGELENPYDVLPSNLQQLSKNISSMGFPLPRVARACKVLGSDHKKIVEYLLVMSELLDLGFSENDVSSALLQCNNDRDKALDILIS